MTPTWLLADTWDDVFPFLIGFGLLVLVPIIAMMTKHQRQMAEIIHRNKQGDEIDDRVLRKLDSMQREIEELRRRQNETILAMEDRKVQQRINE